jgi:hypothetical protein
MAETVIVSPARTVSEESKMGITPQCNVETIKKLHGQPGAPLSDEARARIRRNMGLPKEESMTTNRDAASPADGKRIRFTATVPGHNAGDVAVVSTPRANEYLSAGLAEVVEE